jgi:hypothetical protein
MGQTRIRGEQIGSGEIEDSNIAFGSGASVNADDIPESDTKKWLTTGDQTITGVKTFSSIPVLPDADPTSDNQAARKWYIDQRIPKDGWMAEAGTWLYNVTNVIYTEGDVTANYHLGEKVRLKQGNYKYFIITKIEYISLVNATVLTLYGGTDYTVANADITNFDTSVTRAPKGFPLDPNKWTVKVTDNTDREQTNATAGTWYNLGGVKIAIPIGIWDVDYTVVAQAEKLNAPNKFIRTTLSIANNSETDKEFHCEAAARSFVEAADKLTFVRFTGTARKILSLDSETTYYLNTMSEHTGDTLKNLNSAIRPAVIRARCAYL